MRDGTIHRKTIQTTQIRDLLVAAHGAWVPLPEILALGIAQYNARIWQLRHEYGLTIENKAELGDDGIRRSWFRLVTEPKRGPNRHENAAWFESEFGVGKPKPSTTSTTTIDLPLFDGGKP